MYQKKFEFNSVDIDCTKIRKDLINYLEHNGVPIFSHTFEGNIHTHEIYLSDDISAYLHTIWKSSDTGVRFLDVTLKSHKKLIGPLSKKVRQIESKYKTKET